MDNLFVVKEKVLKYSFLAIDVENPESLKKFSEATGKAVFRYLDIPDSSLITKRAVYKVNDFNKFSQEELIVELVREFQINFDIQLYSLITTDIWVNPDDFEYYVGVAIRFKEL